MSFNKQRTCDFLFSLDLFGLKPELRIGKDLTFKTGLGSILTCISSLTMIVTVIFFSLQLFDDTNPKLTLSIRNVIDPPEHKLSSNNYGFSFGLQDPITYDQFIDESIYRVEVYQKSAVREKVGNTTAFKWSARPLEVGPCSIDKYPKDFQTIFKSSPLQQMYCLKNNSFLLSGTFLYEQYSFLYIQLFECKNATNPNKERPCKPKEYIDKILSGTFFIFSHTDITIDPTNFTYPNQNYAGDSYTTISNKYFKEIHHYVKQINIETDRGWLTTDITNKNYLQNDLIKEMNDFRQQENFLSYTFALSTVIETYTRSYKKVQSVAAEVGGLAKFVSLVCYLITYFYTKSKFYQYLTYELFDCYEYDQNNPNDKRNLSVSISEFNKVTHNSKILII
jgi:hypothetical protein